MAIDRAMQPRAMQQIINGEDDALEETNVELGEDVAFSDENGEPVAIELEDGSTLFDFSGEPDEEAAGAHDANLAEYLSDDELDTIANELVEAFEGDRESRSEWADAYVKGIDQLGMKVEDRTIPWEGATGVFHPLMTEAVLRFQAQSMAEVFPSTGPARTRVIGKQTTELMEQAQRVETELNYQLTENMVEYRDETEQLLFRLPLAGSAFRKVYYDPIEERPAALFVPAEDMIVAYGASDLRTSERYTHVMKRTAHEVASLQYAGLYRDVELPEPVGELSDIEQKYNELNGETVGLTNDDRHTLLEVHVRLDLDMDDDGTGRSNPYVVTIDKSSTTVLSIYRNWDEGDKKRKKLEHFVHYKYVPGMGFYGLGLVHLIGGLAKSATSILRQLIDAGTLSNLPGGLKARGMRIHDNHTPINPGEFRDIDVPSGSIKDAIMTLPYKEPSGVLYQLLGSIVEEGRRIASVADLQVGNMNPEAPVGTTLALLERSMKVMSGIQARVYAAIALELKLIARIINRDMPEEYSYVVDDDANRAQDFDGRVDVIPVADPNAATMAQRVVQYQSALQLAQQAPQFYDMGKLHRQMLEVLGIPDASDIVKLPGDIKPMDPVTENMALLKQEPVKVFSYQDHEAHIRTHMAAMQDPKIAELVGQSPFAQAIEAAATAHITEHLAEQYRVEIQKVLGAELPSTEENLPEEVELEVSRLAAQAADKLLQRNQQEAAQQQARQQAQDPLVQMQQQELQIKQQEVQIKQMEAQHRAQMEQAKLRLAEAKQQQDYEIQSQRIDSEDRRAGVQAGVRIATQLDNDERADAREGAKIALEAAKVLKEPGNEPIKSTK